MNPAIHLRIAGAVLLGLSALNLYDPAIWRGYPALVAIW
jgi:hypothetical protein